MKRIFYIFSLFLVVLLFNCSKEEGSTDKEDPYAENKSLILPGSEYYFIADVYLNGLHRKINMQSTTNNCYSSWGGWYCNSTHKEYFGKLRNTINNPKIQMHVGFRGECPTCSFTDLVTDNLNNYTHTEEEFKGLLLTLSIPKNYIDSSSTSQLTSVYSTKFSPLDLQGENEFNLIEIIEDDTKYIIANFHCALKQGQTSNPSVIEIKNAVFKSKIGD